MSQFIEITLHQPNRKKVIVNSAQIVSVTHVDTDRCIIHLAGEETAINAVGTHEDFAAALGVSVRNG
jgi:hypothetical protein